MFNVLVLITFDLVEMALMAELVSCFEICRERPLALSVMRREKDEMKAREYIRI